MKTKWKTAFVVVLIICIIIAGIMIYQYKQDTKIFTFGNGWEINQKALNSIIEQFEVGEPFRLCKLDGSGCLEMARAE